MKRFLLLLLLMIPLITVVISYTVKKVSQDDVGVVIEKSVTMSCFTTVEAISIASISMSHQDTTNTDRFYFHCGEIERYFGQKRAGRYPCGFSWQYNDYTSNLYPNSNNNMRRGGNYMTRARNACTYKNTPLS